LIKYQNQDDVLYSNKKNKVEITQQARVPITLNIMAKFQNQFVV